VVVEITDNGPGIPPRSSRKIFRAGFTTKKRGWGLGLTLVKRIVEEYHNGRITLRKSKPGETTFEIQLPVGK
jgi:signal transduction histidine kinase